MSGDILSMIRTQWLGDGKALKPHVNVSAVITCAAFSFDPHYTLDFTKEQLTEADNWFLDWATKFIVFYKLSEEKVTERITALVFRQRGDFNRNVERSYIWLNGLTWPSWQPL